MYKRFTCILLLPLLLIALGALLLSGPRGQAAENAAGPSASPATVSGIVVDAAGPVAGAVVRQQTTANRTSSAADGAFTLGNLPEGITVTVTAWSEGYYPGGVAVVPPQAGVTITLRHHPAVDNPDHKWYTSMPDPDEPLGCGHCMVAFPQWVTNAHGTSAVNPRFYSLYNGTDISGTTSVTPGYQIDFPNTAGNCATCHAPGASANHPFTTGMNALSGVEREGVFCDFCHKIAGVYLDPATGLPYANMPGVQSIQLNRPPSDTHMFYGPFDDVVRRVSYLELEKKSQFCAPCHQFSFWGTPIYESFREWLESPYPAQGIECQTCHMAPTGVDYFVYPHQGGLIRPAETIASHLQPGAADVTLLQNTVSMAVQAHQERDRIQVTVSITNTDAGHHVPTDFPGRHMILTVLATGEPGQVLRLREGPTVPDWGGAQADLPGKAFAKVLRDVRTGEEPVVSYWKQALVVSDNRIPALQGDTSRYSFRLPPGEGQRAENGPVTVTAELRFRRVFQSVADARGWNKPDIVMEQKTVTVETGPWQELFLPLVSRGGQE
jgi:hypothetical protein